MKKKRVYANYVISFPKCGRTWLRVALGKIYSKQYNFDDKLIMDMSHMSQFDVFPYFYHDHATKERVPTTDKSNYASKNVVFLVRDPIDVMWSYYFHWKYRAKLRITRANPFKLSKRHKRDIPGGDFSMFLKKKYLGIRQLLAFYKTWSEAQDVPRTFKVIHYEDMHADIAAVLADVIDFFGMEGKEHIPQAVRFSSFSRMKKMEKWDYFNSNILKVNDNALQEFGKLVMKTRRGEIGDGRQQLTDADVAYIGHVAKKHGYDGLFGYKLP